MAFKDKKIPWVLCILVLTSVLILYTLSDGVTSHTYSPWQQLPVGSGFGDGSLDVIHKQSSNSANGIQNNTEAHFFNRSVGITTTHRRQKPSISTTSQKRILPPRGKLKNGTETGTQVTAKAERYPWYVNESSRHPEEVHHVVFVKVHKAASTTVYNVLMRFAMSRKLNVMFPRDSHILSQRYLRLKEIVPHPKIPPFHFDILCNHVIFNHTMISPYFPPDTKYLAIVRDPWTQVQSAYYYYTTKFHAGYLRNAVSFKVFISNQSLFEPRDPLGSFTNNRMSIDLGLPPSHVTNSSYITPFLRHLDSVFHLVLIAERFDESMVLMKRLFGWTMKDIVYRKLNSLKPKKKKTEDPVPDLNEQFKRFHHFDVAVYEHFANIFGRKIKDEGPDFADELETFINITKQISEFCDVKKSGSELAIFRSKWNEEFVVRRAECAVLNAIEVSLNSVARQKQLARNFVQH